MAKKPTERLLTRLRSRISVDVDVACDDRGALADALDRYDNELQRAYVRFLNTDTLLPLRADWAGAADAKDAKKTLKRLLEPLFDKLRRACVAGSHLVVADALLYAPAATHLRPLQPLRFAELPSAQPVVDLYLDVLCDTTGLTVADALTALRHRCSEQLADIKAAIFSQHFGGSLALQPYHFWLPKRELLTVIYAKDCSDEQLSNYRQSVAEQMQLDIAWPALRKASSLFCNRLLWFEPGDATRSSYLSNVHEWLSEPKASSQAVVRGVYSYFHYGQGGLDDSGWGCAYRSCQTICSWYRHQGFATRPIPTHREIQQTLVELGDKPASFAGSRQWIGSLEISYVLERLLGVQSRIVFTASAAELADQVRLLIAHFESAGTPVMIGGALRAHTIVGAALDEQTGAAKFLVLDPHYVGDDDLKPIVKAGWVGWKGVDFWDHTAGVFYNMCLPAAPRLL